MYEFLWLAHLSYKQPSSSVGELIAADFVYTLSVSRKPTLQLFPQNQCSLLLLWNVL